jgi:hypothetical protein
MVLLFVKTDNMFLFDTTPLYVVQMKEVGWTGQIRMGMKGLAHFAALFPDHI